MLFPLLPRGKWHLHYPVAEARNLEVILTRPSLSTQHPTYRFYQPGVLELAAPSSIFSVAHTSLSLQHLFLCYPRGLPHLCMFALTLVAVFHVTTRGILLKHTNETACSVMTRGVPGTNGLSAKYPILIFHWVSPQPESICHSSQHLPPIDFFSTRFLPQTGSSGRAGALPVTYPLHPRHYLEHLTLGAWRSQPGVPERGGKGFGARYSPNAPETSQRPQSPEVGGGSRVFLRLSSPCAKKPREEEEHGKKGRAQGGNESESEGRRTQKIRRASRI